MSSTSAAPFKKILIPLDGSPTAEAVIPYASKLARDFDSCITLLHVASHKEEEFANMGSLFDDEVPVNLEALIVERLREVAGGLRSEGLSVKSMLTYGSPSERIVGFSQKNHYDLIAMSTRGLSGITRWVCGSIASRVLHSTRKPLLLVKPTSSNGTMEEEGRFWKILVPLDGSVLAETVLPVVETLSVHMGCEVTLVRVVSSVSIAARVREMLAALPHNYSTALDSIEKHRREIAGDYLNALKWEMSIRGLTPEVMVAEGDPAAQIIDLSQDMGRPLIVMATHGRTGISRSVLGSVADRVLRGCSNPVLLMRPGN
ncbi:MAG: universal stress protein [Dehalococcoidia bacterium]